MAQAHELAERDYILGMKYREIAAKYNVSMDTVKKWKTRYKWERDKPVKKTEKSVHSVHKNKKVDKDRVDKGGQKPEEQLSDRERLFCHHYVRCWNATQAALKSGCTQNRASAQVAGSRLLTREKVRQEIARLKGLLTEKVHIEAMDVLQQYIKIAFADIGDYVAFGQKDVPVISESGPVTDPETGEAVTRRINYVDAGESELLDTSVISKVKQGKDGFAIEIVDKMKALEKLEVYFDLLPDRFKRRMEEAKLKLAHKKVDNGHKEPVGNVNVIFNIPRPPRGEADA